jgi:hypothetical protein
MRVTKVRCGRLRQGGGGLVSTATLLIPISSPDRVIERGQVTVLKDHFVSFEDRQHLFRFVRRPAKLAQSGDRLPLPFDQLARSLKITLCNCNRIIRHPARLRTRPLLIKRPAVFPVEGVSIGVAYAKLDCAADHCSGQIVRISHLTSDCPSLWLSQRMYSLISCGASIGRLLAFVWLRRFLF